MEGGHYFFLDFVNTDLTDTNELEKFFKRGKEYPEFVHFPLDLILTLYAINCTAFKEDLIDEVIKMGKKAFPRLADTWHTLFFFIEEVL